MYAIFMTLFLYRYCIRYDIRCDLAFKPDVYFELIKYNNIADM